LWPINEIDYVEQLLFAILEAEKVTPVYKSIFGLRLIGKQIWLAPNAPVRSIYDWTRKNQDKEQNDAKLELLMRFRPTCYERLLRHDIFAFELVFAQIHHDFLQTKFNDERRDFVLLHDAVVGLIALDLARYAISNKIDINHVLKEVNSEEFIPKRAPKWQRVLLFRIAESLKLQEVIKRACDLCERDITKIKKEFLELFFLAAAPDYGKETYHVTCAPNRLDIVPLDPREAEKIDPSDLSQLTAYEVRVRYIQTGTYRNRDSDIAKDREKNVQEEKGSKSAQNEQDSICVIEIRPRSRSKSKLMNFGNGPSEKQKQIPWREVCSLDNISNLTLRNDVLQIVPTNGRPTRFKFESRWHAESFLSYIDGYYRHMRRWNFNLSREVFSPDLKYLKKIQSFGPIGLENSKSKLSELGRSGTFLIRQCSQFWHRSCLDVLLPANIIVTIYLVHVKEESYFKIDGFQCGKSLDIKVRTGREKYPTLKSLVDDLEVRVCYDKNQDDFTQQLKHWLRFEEEEHHPALLLSISEKKLRQLLCLDQVKIENPTEHLPKLIPPTILKITNSYLAQAANGMRVSRATFNCDKEVIIKEAATVERLYQDKSSMSPFTFHLCSSKHDDSQFSATLKPEQIRLTDWIFVKSPLFAETVGYVLCGSLIQEYFSLGSMESYLATGSRVSDITKLSVSFQLSQALLYLQERKIIHGKIRCHNIFIYREYPIHVKLSDPLGALDLEQDQAFIPPEYFKMTVHICVKEFYSGIDVWALGTTLWQIFNEGCRPPSGRYANTLTKPAECPPKIWRLIECCWRDNPSDRPSPQALYRDLNDLFAWEKGTHDYFYISQGNLDTQLCPIGEGEEDAEGGSQFSYQSSLADLSSISDKPSPIDREWQDNSQASLIRSSASRDQDGAETLSSYTIITEECATAPPLPSRGPMSLSTSKLQLTAQLKDSAPWRSFIQIRDKTSTFLTKRWSNQTNCENGLPVDLKFTRFDASCSSLLSCEATSEMTGLTYLPQYESISEAFDRCIWHVESSRLKLGPEIGRGSSGVVIKGVLSDADGVSEQVVAVKCINRESSGLNPNRPDDLRREFDILKNLDHKNIVKTLGYVGEAHMMLIFEYMPLGSLMSSIRNLSPQDLREMPLRKYSHDIASGMEYLETKKIVHRDLALRNILMKSRNEVKICDFGLAQFIGTSNHYQLETERALPVKWYAPETLKTWTFTHKSDVWSYGVVLWEIYSGGDHPQYSCNINDLMATLKHERLKRPRDCPMEVYELMLKCWAYEPDERISFSSLREALQQ